MHYLRIKWSNSTPLFKFHWDNQQKSSNIRLHELIMNQNAYVLECLKVLNA